MQIEQVEEKLRALNSKEQDLAKQVGEAEAKNKLNPNGLICDFSKKRRKSN